MDNIQQMRKLLEALFARAKAAGWSQQELAAQAGLRPETLSRAKKRGKVDSLTLEKLTRVLGVELAVSGEPSAINPAGLKDPKWMLAWSNPNIDDDVLIRKALLTARFRAILQACLEFGHARVESQWVLTSQDPDLRGHSTRGLVNDILANIRQGLSHAQR